jgi:hypothetical protein
MFDAVYTVIFLKSENRSPDLIWFKDEITVEYFVEIRKKTPNPKCRLYRCLIEFVDWRYSHVGIFDLSCEILSV